jgi:hypothetical protein
MSHSHVLPIQPAPVSFRDLVLPKEHGSWSLAFEPVVLALLAAPSGAGGFFAAAVAVAFFLRRPFKIALRDQRAERRMAARTVVIAGAASTAIAFWLTTSIAGIAWAAWLVPSAIAGAVFLALDLRDDGREGAAEVAGAAAFAFLPASFAVLAGDSAFAALALAIVMLGRAVPTVLCVRAVLRGQKSGVHRPGAALGTATVAVVAAIVLATLGLAPWGVACVLGLLALRAFALLVFPRPALRARTLGMIEAANGIAFVITVAALWRG